MFYLQFKISVFKWLPFVFGKGGLAEEVDDKVLNAAFLPFGDIVDIQIPLDYETGTFLYRYLHIHIVFLL